MVWDGVVVLSLWWLLLFYLDTDEGVAMAFTSVFSR